MLPEGGGVCCLVLPYLPLLCVCAPVSGSEPGFALLVTVKVVIGCSSVSSTASLLERKYKASQQGMLHLCLPRGRLLSSVLHLLLEPEARAD